VSFAGSTEVGKLLMQQCGGTLRSCRSNWAATRRSSSSDDADIEMAVKGAIASKYRNAGQTRVCATRILVQDGVYDAFTKRLAETAGAMKVAEGCEPGAVIGPLIDMKAVEKVEAHIAGAVNKGAKLGIALPAGEDRWATRRMADSLDAMTVGIQDESAVIMSVIMGPKPGHAIVLPAGGERRPVKSVDRRPIGGAEAEMRARDRRPHLGFAGDSELDAERARCCAIVGAAALAEIYDAYEPEGTQRRIVKTATAVNVPDAHRNMIEHRIPS
jgi:Aldehyde dehydrogenase family